MKTTTHRIRSRGLLGEFAGLYREHPLRHQRLLDHVGGDGPVSILDVLTSNGIDDALICTAAVKDCRREKIMFVCWLYRQVCEMLHPHNRKVVDAFDLYANGGPRDEVEKLQYEAYYVTGKQAISLMIPGAASEHARLRALSFAEEAVSGMDECNPNYGRVRDDAWHFGWDAAREVQIAELCRVCDAAEAGQDPYPK